MGHRRRQMFFYPSGKLAISLANVTCNTARAIKFVNPFLDFRDMGITLARLALPSLMLLVEREARGSGSTRFKVTNL